MKKWISVLLVVALLAVLLFVGGTSRGTVRNTVDESAQTAGEKSQDTDVDDASAGDTAVDTDEDKDTDKNTDNEPADPDATENADASLKIGVILIGDETESYSKSHIDGITQAAFVVGIEQDEIEWKERITDSDSTYDAISELLGDGCNLLIANASIHQQAMTDAAEDYPEARFVVIGGNNATLEGLDNYYNAYTDIYEARYVSGVVAGMKLKQLDRKGKIDAHGYDTSGNVRIGYIASFRNAENISGYSAFYLGVKSVMDNVVLEVKYTEKWLDNDTEATAADALIRSGCPLIAQGTNAGGVAETIEKAWDSGTHVYFVGCSEDAMRKAPNAALTSGGSNWAVYYTGLLSAVAEEQEFAQDWTGGLADGAVSITGLGVQVAPKTAAKVEKIVKKIKAGKLHVFNTKKFTVYGKHIKADDAMIDLSTTDTSDEEESEDDIVKSAIVSYDGGAYFAESTLRSAPYFTLHVDGIKEMNRNE